MSEFIKEVRDILTVEELNALFMESLSTTPSLYRDTFSIRRKITDKVAWFYPSVDNFFLILNEIKDGDKVLDIGCGSAILGKYILEFKDNVTYKGIKKDMYDIDDVCYVSSMLIEHIEDDDLEYYLEGSRESIWILSWPPYNKPMAYQVLNSFYKNKYVKKLLYIGEIEGCNGDKNFNNELSSLIYEGKDGYKVEEHHEFHSFNGLHDSLYVIKKED